MITQGPDWGNRNPLQTIDDDDGDNGEKDSADNDDSVDGDNDVINGNANDLVQSVKILCRLTVKVKPPDASEQLLKVKVEEEMPNVLVKSILTQCAWCYQVKAE